MLTTLQKLIMIQPKSGQSMTDGAIAELTEKSEALPTMSENEEASFHSLKHQTIPIPPPGEFRIKNISSDFYGIIITNLRYLRKFAFVF